MEDGTELKIEFINDVAFHFGDFNFFNGHKTDNPLNILSNKITALSRNTPKDFSDILFLSKFYQFNWIEVINAAKEKDAWVNEVSVAEIVCQFDVNNLDSVNWIEPIDLKVYIQFFKTIAKDILGGGK